ncbi:MBG domain-containing protein, partial [Klebsiella pneumoniae]
KVYGQTDPTFGYAASGQVVNAGLGINDSGLTLTGALGRTAGETVAGGPYAYTLGSLSAGANYTLVMAANPAAFAITPATLTIAPTAGQSKTYGQADPTFAYTASGQVVNAGLGINDSGLT